MQPEHEVSQAQLLQRAMRYCAKCEHCNHDIATWATRLGATTQQIALLIQTLTEQNFLSERRYALAFAADKQRFDGWGTHRIAMALKAKKVDECYIQEALASLPPEQVTDTLRLLLQKRITQLGEQAALPASRQKLLAMAVRKGYGFQEVKAMLTALLPATDFGDTELHGEPLDCND